MNAASQLASASGMAPTSSAPGTARDKPAPWGEGAACAAEVDLALVAAMRKGSGIARCWEGQSLLQQRLLVIADGDLCSQIRHLRYLELLAQVASQVDLQVSADLRPLAGTLPGTNLAAPHAQVSDYDYWVYLSDLPHVFRGGFHEIPQAIPYFYLDHGLIAQWESRLAAVARGRPRVGIAWCNDREAGAIPLATTERWPWPLLLRTEGVAWISLQHAASAPPADAVQHVHQPGPALRDWRNLAACIECLDLVIAVDSPVAHLAGALGRPTWSLLTGSGQGSSGGAMKDPWYPSMQLFHCSAAAPQGAPARRLTSHWRQWYNAYFDRLVAACPSG